ncbi:MAG: hypothetical protein OK442_01915 [Thaumarchaeota archaeon]|nr:hypothetical protein [Nitrososphaerota archaeon]
MTYDIICYKPITANATVDEARRVIYAGDEFPLLERSSNPEEKWRIAAALLRFDPRLRPAGFDPAKLVEMELDGVEKAKHSHIELNNFSPRMSIQLDIHDNGVSVIVPYWFEEDDIGRVISLLSAYLRVIGETAGYFVYDPQVEVAFDPVKTDFRKLHAYAARGSYKDTMRRLPDIIANLENNGKNQQSKDSKGLSSSKNPKSPRKN